MICFGCKLGNATSYYTNPCIRPTHLATVTVGEEEYKEEYGNNNIGGHTNNEVGGHVNLTLFLYADAFSIFYASIFI